MNTILYNAAMEGKVDVLMLLSDQRNIQRTPNGNTVLHVAAQFNQLECVKEILGKHPFLLSEANIKGEIPLHIAAREGYSDIVSALIDCAKELDLESGGGAASEMLRATNHEDKDTAMHMAVRKRNLELVRMLIREDSEFQHPANKAEETPLYLAAERGYSDVVSEILNTCTSPSYGGPDGRTALHAAAIFHTNFPESMEILLKWKRDLIKEADVHGWTPLHYATRCRNVATVKQLLHTDKSVAYIPTADSDGQKTALHIATATGYIDVMEVILLHCPDSWEMVNSKGQNILHIAVNMEQIEVIKFIRQQSWLRHLVNQKDKIEGNTPLHLFAANSDLKDEVSELWFHSDWYGAFNNNNLTPKNLEISTEESPENQGHNDLIWRFGSGRNIVSHNLKVHKKLTKGKEERKEQQEVPKQKSKNKREEAWKRIQGNHFIVATLIATVTFAAGFTLPGGYNGSDEGAEKGMAVLIRKAAFQAFVITNTIALICSTSSAFLYVTASFYGFDKGKMIIRYFAAFILIVIAMGAMTVAFITGSYVVLAHSLVLAIVNCAIGCLFFLMYFLELIMWVTNISKAAEEEIDFE